MSEPEVQAQVSSQRRALPVLQKKRGDLENHDEEKAKRAEDKANKKAFLETL